MYREGISFHDIPHCSALFLDFLDHSEKVQPFLAGKELTLADFSVAAPLFYAKEAELPIGPYARVQEWFGRVSALPCWRETAPQFAAAAA